MWYGQAQAQAKAQLHSHRYIPIPMCILPGRTGLYLCACVYRAYYEKAPSTLCTRCSLFVIVHIEMVVLHTRTPSCKLYVVWYCNCNWNNCCLVGVVAAAAALCVSFVWLLSWRGAHAMCWYSCLRSVSLCLRTCLSRIHSLFSPFLTTLSFTIRLFHISLLRVFNFVSFSASASALGFVCIRLVIKFLFTPFLYLRLLAIHVNEWMYACARVLSHCDNGLPAVNLYNKD